MYFYINTPWITKEFDSTTEKEDLVDTTKADSTEKDELLDIVLEVPGYGKEDITVNVKGDVLFIHGDNGDTSFEKKYNLYNVDLDSIEATCEKGILRIEFEKVENEFEIEVM